jgi:hypothetical protein
MLRWALVLLVVSNLLYWAWHHEPLMQALGWPHPDTQREPERLARQVHPERLQLVAAPEPDSPASDALASTPAAPRCLQSPPLNDSQLANATRQLQQAGLRSDRWVDIRRELPGRWAVYMGRYVDNEQLQRKLDELRRLKLAPEEVVNHPQFSPGFTLGQFDNEPEARARLTQVQLRGVRTARVVVLKPQVVEHRLRLEQLDADAATRLATLTAAWPACTDAP